MLVDMCEIVSKFKYGKHPLLPLIEVREMADDNLTESTQLHIHNLISIKRNQFLVWEVLLYMCCFYWLLTKEPYWSVTGQKRARQKLQAEIEEKIRWCLKDVV